MMASVSGMVSLNVVPCPMTESTSSEPLSFSTTNSRTTSIPTPRPEISVMMAAVENPASKMRYVASRSDMPAASAAEM